jgi:hypothetical protein
MRLLFVHYVMEDRGSAQDMHHYVQVAKESGHEVALYGRPQNGGFSYTREILPADAVVFIFEWTTRLQFGDLWDLVRLVSAIPRKRRVVIDCDGKYNECINVVGDLNHADAKASRDWIAVCDSLSDKIFQPTYHPLKVNVGTFFFHAYHPGWEEPLDFGHKDYGMVYVGNNWYRWRGLARVLRALEPIRARVGRIGLVGNGWSAPPPWANKTLNEDAYFCDSAYLKKLNVETRPPIRFDQVVPTMGKGIFSPVIYRPLFDHLRLITCRTFETAAANTIPLFMQERAFVEEIYGAEAGELVLPQDRPEEKILDILRRPEKYAPIVASRRRHLANRHSYATRLKELVEIVES